MIPDGKPRVPDCDVAKEKNWEMTHSGSLNWTAVWNAAYLGKQTLSR